MDIINGVELYLKSGLLPIYYGFVVLVYLIILYKYKFTAFNVFIVFLASEGLFSYLTWQTPFNNIYKIFFLVFALFLFFKNFYFIKKSKNEYKWLIMFLILSLVYIISAIINDESYLNYFSQIFKKFFIPILFYFGCYSYLKGKLMHYADFFIKILLAQFIFAILKLILWGPGESLVGSISFDGGGPSNVLPTLGFLLIFVHYRGKLTTKHWLYVFALLIVSLIGIKRSIVFILPITIFLTFFLIGNIKNLGKYFKFTPFIIALFALSIKVNPTLNPEKSYWGSFDLEYLVEYSVDYTLGDGDTDEVASGRGSSFITLLNNLTIDNISFFGNGLSVMNASYEDFDAEKFNVSMKGSIGAFLKYYIATGILGLIVIFSYGYGMIKLASKNLFFIILLLYLFDFVLFYNVMIETNFFSVLLLFIIVYYNSLKKHQLIK